MTFEHSKPSGHVRLLAVFFSVLLITSVIAPVAAAGGPDAAVDSTGDTELAWASGDSTQQTSTTDDGLRSSDGDEEPVGGLTATEQGSTISATDVSCNLTVESGGSIQSAIATAEWGETVCVDAGTYEEDLWIDTGGLTLVATGDVTLVPDDETLTGMHVNASGVTVKGFEIREFSRGIHVASETSNVEIRNNLLTANDIGAHLAAVTGTVVDANTITANAENGIEFHEFSSQEGVEITNNTITDNEYHAINAIASLGSNGASGTLVSGNTISNNTGTDSSPAITFERSSDTTIVDNDVRHDGQIGIDIRDYSSDALIERNTITNTPRGIHLSEVSSIEIRDNDIEGLSASAIWMRDSSSIDIVDNRLDGNGQGITSSGLDTLLVETNTVSSEGSDLSLSSTTDATVRDNAFAHGVAISSGMNEQELIHFLHEFEDNTVGGDELVYVRDVDGETITPSSHPDAGQIIVANSTNVEISNFDLDGTVAAIQLGVTEGTTVAHNTIADGVDGERGGIVDMGSTGSVIEHNDVSTVQYGVKLVGGSESVVRDNTVSDTWGPGGDGYTFGILTERYGTDHAIRNNTVTGTYSDGIHVRQGVENTYVAGNTVENSGRDGIHVRWGSENATVVANTIANNGDRGVYVDAEDVVVRNNSIVGNPTGVQSAGDEVDARWNWWGAESGPSGGVADPETGTAASGSGDSVSAEVRFDPWTETEPIDDAPQFAVSVEETNSPITAGETLTIDVTVENTGTEAGTQTIDLEAFDRSVVDSFEDLALGPSENHTVTLIWETDASDAGSGEVTVRSDDDDAMASVSVTHDGPVTITESTVISAPGTYLLDADLTDDSTAIEITSSDVVFDGQGHTIAGVDVDGDGPQYGIHVNGADNVTVEDVTVDGWDTGLYFSGSDGVVADVLVENGGTGAEFANAHDNEVTNLTVRHTENRALTVGGFTHIPASGNIFTNVTAYDNQQGGGGFDPGSVNLGWAASDNEFVGVSASGGVAGIRTASGSSGNTFVDVEAHDNDRYGLNLESSNGDTFDMVNVSGNGWHDIRIGEGGGNTLTNVTAGGEHGTAIYLVGDLSGGPAASHNTFESVTVTDTSENAIGLSNADYNEFTDVTYADSDGRAVSVTSRSENNEFTDVTVTGGTASAAYLAPNDNYDNTFTNVQVTGAQDGLSIYGDGTTVTNLTVEDVGGTGLGVSGSAADSVVSGVTVRNASTGVSMFGSPTSNTIADLTIEDTNTAIVVRGFDNMIANATILDSATGVELGSGTNNWVQSITLGNTIVSATGSDVRLNATADPGEVPTGVDAAGHYVEITNTTEEGVLDQLRLHYDADDLGDIEETSLRVWHFDADGAWHAPANDTFVSGPNLDEQFVGAYGVTEFSTFGVFGETDVDAPNMGALEGTVTGDGSPLEGAQVLAFDADGFGMLAETDMDGNYDLVLPVGSYDLVVNAEGYLDDSLTGVEIEDGEMAVENVDLEPEPNPGTLVGSVTDDETGNIINGATISAEHVDTGEVTTGSTSHGTYSIDLMPGTYTVSVSATGYESTTAEGVTIEEDESTTHNVALLPIQHAIFTHDPATAIVGEPVTFDASASTPPAGTSLTYFWDFTDDGTYVETTDPVTTHVFDEPGDHEVFLGVQDDAYESASTTQTITVEEAPEANIVVYGADVDPEPLPHGDTLSVNAHLYNSGEIAGNETLELVVDGEVVDSQTVTVQTGITQGAATLEWDSSDFEMPEGELTASVSLSLNGFDLGTLHVQNAYTDVQVIAASSSETELIEGEELSVVGSVYQAGTTEGPQEIALNATNLETNETTTVGTQTVTLQPGYYHLGGVNITFEPEPGTYELTLGDRPVGIVEVEPAESDIQVIAASTSEVELIAGEEAYTIGSIYQSGNVEGTETIELTATNTKTDNTSIVGSQEVTLSPGYYHLGAINITFEPETGGTYELELGDRPAGTVEVDDAESDIQVIAASTSEVEMVAGEEAYTVGSIYQSGNIEGTETIELTATNTETDNTTVVGSQEVTLSPGYYHLGAINITFEPETGGTYELELGDRPAGTVEVDDAESDIQVIAASTSEVELIEGEEAYTIGSVYQAGNIEGTETIELTATNTETNETEVVGSQDVTLSPGYYHLGALNITFEPETGGTYDLELGDRPAGTVEVEDAVSDIQVIAASTSEVEMIEGEEAYTIGSVYQAGNVEGTETIELTATHNETGDTEVVGSQEVTLQPGYYHLGAINITFEPETGGTYELELGDRPAGTVEVEDAISDIQVIAASPDGYNLTVGEEVNVIGSVYQAGNVEGTEEIELTATHTETGNTTSVGSQEVTLSPGFYHLGALNVTFAPDEAGTYDLELGNRSAGSVVVNESLSDIQVVGASVADVELIEGEQTHVIGSIYQAGEEGGTETIELTATHNETGETEVVGSQDVTLSPGFYHLGAINITFEPEAAGTYDLQLGDRDAGWVEVEEAVSDIQVIAASTSEVEMIEGEEAYTIGSIYQSGNIEGTETIELTATHTESGETTTVGSQDVTLEPGYYHLGALNISFQPDIAGTYDLELGGRAAGTVEVEPAVSDIQVIAASTSDVEIALGQETYVIGSIYQAGTVEGTEELELTATHDETGETEVVGSQTATLAPGYYHLGALNVTFEPGQTGTYTLELGDRTAGTVDVVEPTVDPSITDVAGHSSGYDVDLEADVVYTSENAPVEIDVESDLDIESVTLLVSSLQTTYSISADAEHNGGNSWSVEVPVDDIPDDGVYELSVVAVDAVGTGGFADASERLVIDREEPGTSVTLEGVDGEDATVVIESDEPLTGAPTVSAELVEPDGSTSDVPVTIESDDGTGTLFTGTLEFDESGNYTVTVAGTDRAGNVGEDTASVVVNTAFTLGDGEIIVADTGTSIAFDLIDDVDDAIATQELYVALSENSLNTDLDGGKLGVGFLTADLDDFINHQLGEEDGLIESATITMAIDDGALPDGTDATDVSLYHYEGDSTWDPVDSEVIDVGGDPFVTATVPGFSTYGALVSDEQDPVVTSVSPSDGSTLAAGTDETTVRFEYEDDLSGIDVGAVTLTLDGTDVTIADGTQITSAYAEHTFAVVDGDSHTVAVTVVDEAGNEANAMTSFTVGDDSSSSPTPAPLPSPSPDPEDDAGDDDSTDSDVTDDDDGTADDPDGKEDGSDDGTAEIEDGSDDSAAETDDDSDAGRDDGDAGDESGDGIPGFGLVAALVALLAIALFRTR
ncbi:right-handed parallel beta-helix repeat-containing protein [Natronorubrum sp. DTA28]|uniref:right-handed parallel beta-helix repeat-containing protein n=1 Tax=Natronorubrum sp. DTA28 TaxID=3447019 RepID=UPI003F86A814